MLTKAVQPTPTHFYPPLPSPKFKSLFSAEIGRLAPIVPGLYKWVPVTDQCWRARESLSNGLQSRVAAVVMGGLPNFAPKFEVADIVPRFTEAARPHKGEARPAKHACILMSGQKKIGHALYSVRALFCTDARGHCLYSHPF